MYSDSTKKNGAGWLKNFQNKGSYQVLSSSGRREREGAGHTQQVIQSSFVEAPWRQSGGGERAGVVVFSLLPL